ncbi:MAG TPA: hypothetical protein DDW94_02145 [Deltaproteobacteria bacterium]|nr:MAG: hypothetical protein A2Z79_09695 [Deltaproteobacteria bacterium GWA2_55_82]OGQ64991.1 MAG: hypothetical protein A3I81_01930 [Deltaproteobacteria bacterium RIFCSPLOWO2_02_FULL_55_12]OIJ73825.1 MAG: hypothetical protein A2V21_305835 [Deltaproteobacteria bacterium GWC2_55_46]HBG45769.1 hypothetical protein [Deltaproteobacteria bacterium]HCY09812.1 hypothetical protein [Deltaproteobacteria bacterium]
MESPGEYLRRERELRGVSLVKIFEATKVPMKFLEAIEADRYEGLPPAAFVKGFIRSYCKVLGVDETDAVLRFEVYQREKEEAEAEGAKAKAAPAKGWSRKALTQKPSVKLPDNLRKPAFIAAGILIIVIAYAFSIKKDASAPVEVIAPAVQAPLDSPAQSTVPSSHVAAPVPPSPLKQTRPVVKDSASPAPVLAPAPAKATEPVKKEEALKPQAAVDPAGAPPVAHTLTASAKEMVWLKIVVDGAEPVEVLLRQGERFTWKGSEGFSVLVGNAGGVTLTYNGKELSSLGLSGEVVSLKLPSGTQQRIMRPERKSIEPLTSPARPDKEINFQAGPVDNINAKML